MFRGEAARADEIARAFVDDGLRGGQFLWDENNMNNRDVEVRSVKPYFMNIEFAVQCCQSK